MHTVLKLPIHMHSSMAHTVLYQKALSTHKPTTTHKRTYTDKHIHKQLLQLLYTSHKFRAVTMISKTTRPNKNPLSSYFCTVSLIFSPSPSISFPQNSPPLLLYHLSHLLHSPLYIQQEGVGHICQMKNLTEYHGVSTSLQP